MSKTLRCGTALMAGLATSLGSGIAAGALAPLLGPESEFFLWAIALFVWTLQLRRSRAESASFQEVLLPGLFAILLGFGGAAVGSRAQVAGPDGSRDAS